MNTTLLLGTGLLFAGALLLSAEPAGQPGVVQSEFIYDSAPFPEVHASTIAESNGRLIAAFFGGTHERHDDVGVWVSRRENAGWTPPVEVATGAQPDGKRLPCWNPVLFQPTSGPLLLFYKVGPSPSTWWGMMITSDDAGKTWSPPRRLPDGILGPIKNKPVQLPGGDLLCPTSDESDGWVVYFERTPDLGETWEKTGLLNDPEQIGAIQPTVLVHADGRLQALGRTKQKLVFTTESTDGGRTWSDMTLTDLPNPNSGVDAVTLRDGRHLLVYNHAHKTGVVWSGGREVLNVAVSRDGEEWFAAATLEREPKGEFSYPAVIQSEDGLVHITYTWDRKRVRRVVMNPERLTLTRIRDGVWPEDR